LLDGIAQMLQRDWTVRVLADQKNNELDLLMTPPTKTD
jgi:hypothetical protein